MVGRPSGDQAASAQGASSAVPARLLRVRRSTAARRSMSLAVRVFGDFRRQRRFNVLVHIPPTYYGDHCRRNTSYQVCRSHFRVSLLLSTPTAANYDYTTNSYAWYINRKYNITQINALFDRSESQIASSEACRGVCSGCRRIEVAACAGACPGSVDCTGAALALVRARGAARAQLRTQSR